MSIDILQMLVDSACSEGSISQQDRELLSKKAAELGVSAQKLEEMIQNALNPQKLENQHENIENNSSGFVVEEKIETPPPPPPINHEEITKSSFSDVSTLDNQGAMSIVYRAKLHGKWIIIKRIKPEFKTNQKYKELFYKEFENAYHLDHPNIVRLLDKGEDAEGAFYTMEFVDGQPLSKLITPAGIKDERLIKRIMLQILDALTYVHKKQIYHRDLKPDNILVTYRGDNVKMLDFGLASADSFDDDLIKVGTPKYAAPEQMNKGYAADHKSDIYTLGLIFLEMLTGKVELNSVSAISNSNYKHIIETCTKQNPNERFHDCQEIIEWINKPVPQTNVNQQQNQTQNELVTLKSQADSAFANKDYQTAKSLYEKCLAKNPNDLDSKKKHNICVNNLKSTGTKKKFPLIPVLIGVVVIAIVVVGFLFKDKIFGEKIDDNQQDTTQIVVVDNFKIFKEKADSLFAQQQYQDALSFYENAKKEKDNPEVNQKIEDINKIIEYRNQADNFFDKDKNLIKAIEFYKKVQEINKNDTHSTNRIAECEKIINNTDLRTLKTTENNGKNGLVNADNYLIIDYLYDEIAEIHYDKNINLIPVKIGSKWGFIDNTKKMTIGCEYDECLSHTAGFRVKKNGQTYVVKIDAEGKAYVD